MRTAILKALMVLVLTGVFSPISTPLFSADNSSARIQLTPNADYFGFDYDIIKDTPLENCISVCRRESACQAFTYNQNSQWCFLKSDYKSSNFFEGTIAGRKVSQGEASGTIKPTGVDPVFVTSKMKTMAGTLPRRFRRWYKPGDKGFVSYRNAGLQFVGSKKFIDAGRSLGSALALFPDDAEVLIAYSRALLSQPNLRGKKRTLVHEVSTSAVLLALRSATTAEVRAEGFNALAEVLMKRKYWRMAMKSYQSSLALVTSPAIEKQYATLLENHGFRVLKHSVDADTENPRICVHFSEDLKENADLTRFVRVDGRVPDALKRNGNRQLCLEGAKHGTRYAVSVRSGIPSNRGNEVLAKPVDLNVYVDDRDPSVRFSGDGFVLPRIGSRGIPVVTINSGDVDIQIFRIGERNLTSMLQNDQFLEQLSEYKATRISDKSGEKVWSGKLSVKGERNREITTSFPISEALPKRLPGVYVMMAKPSGDDEDSDWESKATQWFVVSDIGLTSFSGDDGLHIFTRSLSTAQALGNTKIRLMARNNNVLAEGVTDAQGYTHFEAGIVRGTGGNSPSILVAEGKTGDTVLIDLNKPSFDLSDRGVTGRAVPPPIDAYLYTERGIYRPGATIHAVTLLRDQNADVVRGVPLTFILTRPDGVEHRRLAISDSGLGSYAADISLSTSVMRGTWRIGVYTDPKKDALSEKAILVEDFLPDRFEFDLTSSAAWLEPDGETTLQLAGRFLYGAPAAGLQLDGGVRIRSVRNLPGFTGYRFGLADEEPEDGTSSLSDLPATDARGLANIGIDSLSFPASTRPFKVTISVRMNETGGRAVERSTSLPVRPVATMIGIRPIFKEDLVGEGETAQFDIISVGSDGAQNAQSGLKWELIKLERSFQWYREDGRWNYEAVEYTKRVANGVVDTAPDKAIRIAAKVDWGSYRLEVTGNSLAGAASSVKFSAGWHSSDGDADTPDFLEIALDKPAYRPGDTAKVNITPRYDGVALVTIMGEKLVARKVVEVKKGGTEVSFSVGQDWGAGAYVTATLYRSMDVAASRNPTRAIGLKWLGIDNSPRTLGIAFDLPDQFRPGQKLTLPIGLSGLENGEEAYISVAAVDVGILNLTSFQPPAPEKWYFGQRKLGMAIRDIYGRLINGMLGVRGKIRTGSGDDDEESGMSMKGTPPAQKPVSLFSGIVRMGADGKANITFDVPQFNGTLRLMAVGWSKTRIGHGTADLIVRDPVVVSASLPRFLAPGDVSRLHLDVVNTDGPAGTYALTLKMPTHLGLGDPVKAVPLELAISGKTALSFPIYARHIGSGDITLNLKHPSGVKISQVLTLAVRAAQPSLTKRQILPLAANGKGSLSLDSDFLAGLRPETASLTLSITRAGRIDLPGLLLGLDRYPYGCSEQITSRALPLLYLGDVAKLANLNAGEPVRERVQKAIYKLLTRQSYSGGFGLWRPGSDDLWLSAYVADFLTRAREQKYDVPEEAFNRALTNLENNVSYNQSIVNEGRDTAYALYVLSRNGRGSLGDLRYFTDSRFDEFTSPLARAQLGASFTYYGDQVRASSAFKAAMSYLPVQKVDFGREDYGSSLRDVAAITTLNAESKPTPIPLEPLEQILQARRAKKKSTSTQEKAWLLLAAHSLLKEDQSISLRVNGDVKNGNYLNRFSLTKLAVGPVHIVNQGAANIDAVVSVRGVPDQPLPMGGNGMRIERHYYSLDGKEISIDSVGQTQRMIVVLKVHENKPIRSRLLIVDRLPAGLEIDNPSLVTSATLKAFKWLPKTASAAHSEFRDDRFVAAMERYSSSDRDFALAYMVRAVSPGSYVVPPAVVEDMYRPHLNARTSTGRLKVLDVQR